MQNELSAAKLIVKFIARESGEDLHEQSTLCLSAVFRAVVSARRERPEPAGTLRWRHRCGPGAWRQFAEHGTRCEPRRPAVGHCPPDRGREDRWQDLG